MITRELFMAYQFLKEFLSDDVLMRYWSKRINSTYMMFSKSCFTLAKNVLS